MWRVLSTSLAIFALGLGCVHPPIAVDKAQSASELGVVDPDPSRDKSPEFCNPAGRQDADLKRCLDQNAALYKEFAEEAKRREPWFNFAGDGWLDSQELDGKFVVVVVDEASAVARLESTQFIELSSEEANKLSGKTLQIANRKPYLVRALMYHKDNGRFAVFEKGQDIFIRHDSMGSATQQEHRTAVIVYLPYKPTNVFIDCQVL